MRKFILQSLLFTLPLMLLLPGWYYLLTKTVYGNYKILNFQVAKLKRQQGKHFNTIYIGDSGGGYAISTKKDSSSINLCLTGTFGYGGLISFLDIIDQYITYDTVIVMNIIHMPTQKVRKEARWVAELHSKDLVKQFNSVIQSNKFGLEIIISIFSEGLNFDESDPSDYPVSYGKTKEVFNGFKLNINPEKISVMKELNDKLMRSGHKFIFLYGPTLPFDHKYLDNLNDTLKKRGIKHAFNDPFIMQEDSKGDTNAHIHPDFRDSVTRFYRNMIEKAEF
jgi:hypothetical protein